jgi:pimeloyl-ACP methyl ester carboxylesterase
VAGPLPPTLSRCTSGSRRRFLTSVGYLPAALSSAAAPSPAVVQARAAVVLIHGAWHNSFCWYEVAQRLRAQGRQVVAIDLPGHGVHARYPKSYFADGQVGLDTEPSPLGEITLDVAAGAVVSALKQVQGAMRPILVGHSLGGAVITRAAELASELIGQLVYLTAFLPTRVGSPAALYALPEARTVHNTLAIGDPARIGAVRFNPRGNLDYLKQLHSVFYQDVALERFLPFSTSLSPDLPLPLWVGETRATPARWGSIPRTYIHCTQDRAIPPALQLRMIADADATTPRNRCQVLTLQSSHSPFVSRVEELTTHLSR